MCCVVAGHGKLWEVSNRGFCLVLGNAMVWIKGFLLSWISVMFVLARRGGVPKDFFYRQPRSQARKSYVVQWKARSRHSSCGNSLATLVNCYYVYAFCCWVFLLFYYFHLFYLLRTCQVCLAGHRLFPAHKTKCNSASRVGQTSTNLRSLLLV